MIKQLHLRGISRTPSDRMNEDGGVADSINGYIAENEYAPIYPAEDVAAKFSIPQNSFPYIYDLVYIHKVQGQENCICIMTKLPSVGGEDGEQTIMWAVNDGEFGIKTYTNESIIPSSIIAIGNTLKWSTTKRNGYALWKNGIYTYLGEEIPELKLYCEPKLYGGDADITRLIFVDFNTQPYSTDEFFHASWWNNQIQLPVAKRSKTYNNILNELWDKFSMAIVGNSAATDLTNLFTSSQDSSFFSFPVFVRFAIKLYDGTYIHHTTPIYMGASGFEYKTTLRTVGTYDGGCYWVVEKKNSTDSAYKIKVRSAEDTNVFNAWKDIIHSIDMFISEPILYPAMRTPLASAEQGADGDDVIMRFRTFPEESKEWESKRDIILNATRNFYLVKSYSIDNLTELMASDEISNSQELYLLEKLVVKQSLPDDFRSNHTYIKGENKVINNRLLTSGMVEQFYKGQPTLYGLVQKEIVDPTEYTNKLYQFVYEITDSDGSKKCVYGKSVRTNMLSHRSISFGSQSSSVLSSWSSDAAQILFYPDTRCTAIYIKWFDARWIRKIKLETKVHPHLNCAYWIGDIDKTLGELSYTTTLEIPEEDNTGSTYSSNWLFVTDVNNPFYYPVGGRIRFSDKLISVASITTALSEGQFGQFDLYAFTDKGIWVLNPNDEGAYMNMRPLTRDVALSSESIVPIDQAIVFISKNGVHLLSGSSKQNLSESMIGIPLEISTTEKNIINSKTDNKYEKAINKNVAFMKFMETAQIAYDYTGSRLIFVNPTYSYDWVFMLKTATWHRYVYKDEEKITKRVLNSDEEKITKRVLNSFPNCYVFKTAGGVNELLDYSTPQADMDLNKEIDVYIHSRSFSLGEDDILKSISQLKIRGRYDSTKVKYLLLGSQDNKQFIPLSSLRGKSYKWFKIAILAKLKPDERISSIEFNYDRRFTNKLR